MIFSLFCRNKNKLPVLMYHKTSNAGRDYLTVSTDQLEAQLSWLAGEGFHFISLTALIEQLQTGAGLPEKPVLLTFDDGYASALELAYPILKKYKAKAFIFLPTFYLGKGSYWDARPDMLMTVEQIKSLDPEVFEAGLHSHRHQNYQSMSAEEIRADVRENWRFLEENGIHFIPAFAYPYGGRPKKRQAKEAMKGILRDQGIQLGFRIGNRINWLPRKAAGDLGIDFLEINRIDVRGDESLEVFKRKVRFGKLGLF